MRRAAREAARESAVVSARGAARIRAGLCWVFRQDVLQGPSTDARNGGPAVVNVFDRGGSFLAAATWAAGVPLSLRVLARLDEEVPSDLLELYRRRLREAMERRRNVAATRDAFRVAHAEADRLPGLFVDRYADTAVIQTSSVATDLLRSSLADCVRELLGVRLVVARDDGGMRDFEGLPRSAATVCGTGAARCVYRIGDVRFETDLLVDGKTGGFLDQAENHAVAAALTPRGARCLDAFAHHGGFALAMARRAASVLAVEQLATSAERVRANAHRNALANVTVRTADAFEVLRKLEATGEMFDVVVLDPPSLAKRASDLRAAGRGYRELLLRGLRLTRPSGILMACCCSAKISRADWDALVTAAAARAGRAVEVVERRGAGADHPELLGVPETGHLKCWVLRVG